MTVLWQHNLLFRSSFCSHLNSTQLAMDAMGEELARQSLAPSVLLPMTFAPFAFRLSKILSMEAMTVSTFTRSSPLLFRSALSSGLALASEVFTYQSSQNLLKRLLGQTSNLESTTQDDFWGTAFDFSVSKMFGPLGSGNFLLGNFVQSASMMGAHEISARWGWSASEEGSFVEKLARTQARILSMSFGLSTFHMLTGGRSLAPSQLWEESPQIIRRKVSFQETPRVFAMASEESVLRREYSLRIRDRQGNEHPYRVFETPDEVLTRENEVIELAERNGKKFWGTIVSVDRKAANDPDVRVEMVLNEQGRSSRGMGIVILRGGMRPVFELYYVNTELLNPGAGTLFVSWAVAQAASRNSAYRIARIQNTKVPNIILRHGFFDSRRPATINGFLKFPMENFRLDLDQMNEEHMGRLFSLDRLIAPQIDAFPNPEVFRSSSL